MNYHDDANDPNPEGGYCPVCYDVAMEVVSGYEDANGIYMTLECPVCGLQLDWQSQDDSSISIPPYET